MATDQELAIGIIQRIEQEVEELKDVLHVRGIKYSEMSNQERDGRRERRATNVDGSPDRRFKENREGPTGQGEVRNPQNDRRLVENRG